MNATAKWVNMAIVAISHTLARCWSPLSTSTFITPCSIFDIPSLQRESCIVSVVIRPSSPITLRVHEWVDGIY